MSEKKTSVLVTGASSGIGAAIAKTFSQKNYHVILAGRSLEKLKKTQSECDAETTILDFDLKNVESSFAQITEVLSKIPKLEILINNAGIFQTASFDKTTDESWQQQFEVNFFSAVKLTRFLWPIFVKQNKGSILNISSSLGTTPSAGTSAYSASKAAMNNWTLNLAQEGGIHNIRANAICPGIIDTPIHSFHSLPEAEKAKNLEGVFDLQLLKSLGTPEDIARSAYFLGSDESRWTTGTILTIDGGISLK